MHVGCSLLGKELTININIKEDNKYLKYIVYYKVLHTMGEKK